MESVRTKWRPLVLPVLGVAALALGPASAARAESNEVIVIEDQCMDNEVMDADTGKCECELGYFPNAWGFCDLPQRFWLGSPVDILGEVCDTGACDGPGGHNPGNNTPPDSCSIRVNGQATECTVAAAQCEDGLAEDGDLCEDDPIRVLCQGLTFPFGEGSDYCTLQPHSSDLVCEIPGVDYTVSGSYAEIQQFCEDEWFRRGSAAATKRCQAHAVADYEGCIAKVSEGCKNCDAYSDGDAEQSDEDVIWLDEMVIDTGAVIDAEVAPAEAPAPSPSEAPSVSGPYTVYEEPAPAPTTLYEAPVLEPTSSFSVFSFSYF